jgi:hypothetical protein
MRGINTFASEILRFLVAVIIVTILHIAISWVLDRVILNPLDKVCSVSNLNTSPIKTYQVMKSKIYTLSSREKLNFLSNNGETVSIDSYNISIKCE